MIRAFISHSSSDRKRVEELIIPLLNRYGIETWYSKDSIQVADQWEKKIKEGLANCTWFIAILSPKSVASEWVQAEVHWALEFRRGKVVPVLIEDCEIEECHLKLRQIQFVNFCRDTPSARRRLLSIWGIEPTAEDLEAATDPEDEWHTPLVQPVSADPPVRSVRSFKRILWAVGGTLIILIALGFGIMNWLQSGNTISNQEAETATTHLPAELATVSDSSNITFENSPAFAVSLSLGDLFTTLEPISEVFEGIPEDRRLTYVERFEEETLKIEYRLPYLQQYQAGGPISGIDLHKPPFVFAFPNLAIKALNNSDKTILVSRAVFEITESEPIDTPFVVVYQQIPNRLLFQNEGWGVVLDPVVNFSLLPQGSEIDLEQAAVRHSLQVASFDERQLQVNVVEFVPDHLADAVFVTAVGELIYGPRQQRTSIAFRTDVALDIRSGSPAPANYQYAVLLEPNPSTTAYNVSLSQQIKPGEADHFLIRVASTRTARYQGTIQLLDIHDRVLDERQFQLSIFVPRTQAKYAVQRLQQGLLPH